MKLNTNISLENIVTIIALICSVTLAFGFMQYDIDIMKKELDLKADKRQTTADRELIEYKLDVIIKDIAEIKQVMSDAAKKVIGAPIGVDTEIIRESYVQKKDDKKRWEQLYEKLIKAKSGRIASTREVD